MTRWEIGQDLIRLHDLISETQRDFRLTGEKGLIDRLDSIRCEVANLFNDYNDHSFRLGPARSIKNENQD